MNPAVDNPPPPGQDLDVLLEAFFRAEMPAPWPPFRAPSKSRTLPLHGRQDPRRQVPESNSKSIRHLFGSRAALAASIGLLMLAGLLLGGKSSPISNQALPELKGPGNADRTKRFQPFQPSAPSDSRTDKMSPDKMSPLKVKDSAGRP